MSNDNQTLLVSLGWGIVGRVDVRESTTIGQPFQQVRLQILTASCTDDGTHTPAESVEVYGLDKVTALCNMLSKAIAIAHKGATVEPVVEAVNQAAIDQHEPKP